MKAIELLGLFGVSLRFLVFLSVLRPRRIFLAAPACYCMPVLNLASTGGGGALVHAPISTGAACLTLWPSAPRLPKLDPAGGPSNFPPWPSNFPPQPSNFPSNFCIKFSGSVSNFLAAAPSNFFGHVFVNFIQSTEKLEEIGRPIFPAKKLDAEIGCSLLGSAR